MAIHIRKSKDKKLFIVEIVSPVNGKTLSTSRGVSQKVSVGTNLSATARELGMKVGSKIKAIDETGAEPVSVTFTV